MYAVLLISSFGGIIPMMFAMYGLGAYLLGLSIFFVIDLSKSKRQKRPISKLLKGMALSSAGVFAVVLGVVLGVG